MTAEDEYSAAGEGRPERTVVDANEREGSGRGEAIPGVSVSDGELVEQSLATPHLFSELFRRHSGAVYGYVARRAGRDVADEVLSETFLVAFERRDRFQSDATSARPWLLGIATNLVHAHRRRAARHLHLLQQSPETAGSLAQATAWMRQRSCGISVTGSGTYPLVTATSCCCTPGPT